MSVRSKKSSTRTVDPARLYDEVSKRLADAGLIISAVGGVVLFGHPDALKEEGLWCKAQWWAKLGGNPGDVCECQETGINGICVKK